MNLKLNEISIIQIGFQARDEFYPDAMAKPEAIRIVQIKDVQLEAETNDSFVKGGKMLPYLLQQNLNPIVVSRNIERYRIKRNDVLFLSRGSNMFAFPIVDEMSNVIASYYFYIVRPDTTRILPEYLAWYINQPKAQAHLAMYHHGSIMQMVPKAFFEELEIEVPSIEDQRKIVELEKLRQEEEFIMRQLAIARKRLVNGLCMQYLQKNSFEENQDIGATTHG